MKSDRRHELKHNELSDWLGERMQTIQPHATAIALGAVALFAAVIIAIRYFGMEDSASAQGWSKYFNAVNDREPTKVLEKLATQSAGSKPSLWAHQAMADMQLSQGAAMLHTDRSEAQKLLQKAEASYKHIENASDPMLKTRARLGLAKVYESLCKPEEARKYYEMVAEAGRSEAIGKAAAEDAQRLKNSRQVAFLEWFAKQQPKRPAPMSGLGGGLGGLPNLPDRPDISPPIGLGLDNLGAGLPAEVTPAFPAPGTEAKSEGGTPTSKSDEAKPDEAKPDEAKPAEPKSE
jgi:hypothetical protein